MPRGTLRVGLLFATLVVAWGCSVNSVPDASDKPTDGGSPRPGGPGGGAASDEGRPGSDDANSIRQIMSAIGKGPHALATSLEQKLNAEDPDWDSIQPKAAELAKVVATLSKSDPPRGSKESWSKLTAAFAASATALDKAAKGKDLEAARTARMKLGRSCMECHRQHRGGRGGPGGDRGSFGGPPRDSGTLVSPFVQERLKLSDGQKKELHALQEEVDAELDKILTDEQRLQLKELRQGGGRRGPREFGREGGGGPGRPVGGGPAGPGRDGPGRNGGPGQGPHSGGDPGGPPEAEPPVIEVEGLPLKLP
jgi:hypothetical protein